MIDTLTASERWPTIERLVRLGWSVALIEYATGWSRETITADLQVHGGIKQRFPDRPKGGGVYAATIQALAKDTFTNDRERAVAEDYLELPYILAWVRDTSRDSPWKDTYVHPWELRNYVRFALIVLKAETAPDAEGHWLEILKDIARDRYFPPTNREMVIEIFRHRLSPPNLNPEMAVLLHEGLRDTIIALLHSDLRKEEVEVLAARFGLARSGVPNSPIEVAQSMNLTVREVREIEKGAFRKLHLPRRMRQIASHFCTVQSYVKHAEESIARVNELVEQLAELRQWQDALVEDIRNGNRDQAITRIIEIDRWVAGYATLDRKFGDEELSKRSRNNLERAGFETFGQLIQCKEARLLKSKGFGRKSLNEIKEILSDHDLALGTTLPADIAARFPLPPQFR